MNAPLAREAPGRRPLPGGIIDRPDGALAVLAAWIALMAGLVVGGGVGDPVAFAAAGAIGAVLVTVGFAAASRCRSLAHSPASLPARIRVTAAATGVGLAMGLANLAANRAIAQLHPEIRAALEARFAALGVVDAVVVAPLVEEVVLRLFLLSVIAWLIVRLTGRATLAFAVALVGSSVLFAALHLERQVPADLAVANYYRAALMAKYTLAGLPLGWLFWRWGLPYAIVCHAAVNATHLALQPVVFPPPSIS